MKQSGAPSAARPGRGGGGADRSPPTRGGDRKVAAPRREVRQLALLWGVATASAVALRPFWLALAPLLPACPMREVTGVPCPTCGTTRAAVALLDGDIGAALLANPLAAVAAVAFVLGGALAAVWAWSGGPLPELPRRLSPALRAGIVAALIANWAWVIAHR